MYSDFAECTKALILAPVHASKIQQADPTSASCLLVVSQADLFCLSTSSS